MKTQEVEKIVGVSKQTLFYYENESLIKVERDHNGYRNYTDLNIQELSLIKFLRDLDVSIDDIRAFLTGDLSFQEMLSIKRESMEEIIEDQKKIFEKLTVLNNKNVPMIPGIETMEMQDSRNPLSFWKSTKTVSIGRPITHGFIVRQIAAFICISLVLAISFLIGLPKILNRSLVHPYLIFFSAWVLILFLILYFWFSDLMPSGSPFPTSRINFVEFNETGIRYFKSSSPIKNFYYLRSVLRGEKVGKFQTYEDIESVTVNAKQRYMKPYGYSTIAPAISVHTPDFEFAFKDGESLFLLSPMMLGNDTKWVARIVKNKIARISDPDNILDMLC